MNILILIGLIALLSHLAKKRRCKPRQIANRHYKALPPSPPQIIEYRPASPSPAELRRVQVEAYRRQAEAEARQRAKERAQRAIIAKEQERRRAEEAHRQAQQDLDHWEIMREQYMNLADELEAERDAKTTTPRRRQQLTRQLITLEEKLYNVERRRCAAYAKLQEV